MSESGEGKQNLGNMFAKSSGRTRGALADRVQTASVAHDVQVTPPVPVPLVPVPEPEPSEDVVKAPDAEPGQKTGSKKKAAAKKPAKSSATDGPTDYPIYVPAQILPEFRKRRDAEGTQNALLLFDAIDELVDPDAKDPYEKLRGYVQASLVGGTKQSKKPSLFERKPTKVQNSVYTGPAAQITLRLTQAHRDIIDELIEKTGAKDRGHLATVALVHYLGLAKD
jgi:hypothetical protein